MGILFILGSFIIIAFLSILLNDGTGISYGVGFMFWIILMFSFLFWIVGNGFN